MAEIRRVDGFIFEDIRKDYEFKLKDGTFGATRANNQKKAKELIRISLGVKVADIAWCRAA